MENCILKKAVSCALALTMTVTGFAFSGTENSACLNSISASAASVKPANTRIIRADTTSNSVKLYYSKARNAKGYYIYQKSGKSWKKIGTAKGTSYTVKKLKSAARYQFTVRAYNGRNLSSSYKTYTAGTKLPGVSITKAEPAYNSVKLTWNKVSGAKKYNVYIKSSNSWKRLNTITGTSYTFKSLKANTTYNFAVKAYRDSFSSNTSYKSVKTKLSNVSPKVNSVTNNSVRLTWNKVSGATKYTIYKKSGSKYITLADVTGTSYTAVGLAGNTEYSFAIRAYTSGNSSNMAYVSARTKLNNIVKVNAYATNTTVTLSWDKVSGSKGYNVYQKIKGSWVKLANTSGTKYTVNSLNSGENYTFSVEAYNDKSASQSKAETTIMTKLNNVQITKTDVAQNSVKLYWNKVNGATGYIIYQKVGSSWTKLAQITNTSYTVTKLKPNTSYTFAVEAYNGKVLSQSKTQRTETTKKADSSSKAESSSKTDSSSKSDSSKTDSSSHTSSSSSSVLDKDSNSSVAYSSFKIDSSSVVDDSSKEECWYDAGLLASRYHKYGDVKTTTAEKFFGSDKFDSSGKAVDIRTYITTIIRCSCGRSFGCQSYTSSLYNDNIQRESGNDLKMRGQPEGDLSGYELHSEYIRDVYDKFAYALVNNKMSSAEAENWLRQNYDPLWDLTISTKPYDDPYNTLKKQGEINVKDVTKDLPLYYEESDLPYDHFWGPYDPVDCDWGVREEDVTDKETLYDPYWTSSWNDWREYCCYLDMGDDHSYVNQDWMDEDPVEEGGIIYQETRRGIRKKMYDMLTSGAYKTKAEAIDAVSTFTSNSISDPDGNPADHFDCVDHSYSVPRGVKEVKTRTYGKNDIVKYKVCKDCGHKMLITEGYTESEPVS